MQRNGRVEPIAIACQGSVLARVEFLWRMAQKEDGRLDQALSAWKVAVADDPALTGPGKDAEEQIQRHQ